MNRSELAILVVGGTGHQGGAAARHLLKDGWKVRALVRDPDKPASQALAKAGCELAKGDLLDPASLYQALDGCHGAYLMTTPREVGPDGEAQEGFDFVDACSHAGIEHLVFSSVIGADREDGATYQMPKHRIEAHIAEMGMHATIWRPVTFLENFLGQKEVITSGHLRAPVEADVVRQFIAVDDIGKFVALAFREHDRFVGVTAEIASDEMTMPQVAEVFSLVLDVPVVFEQIDPLPGMTTVRRPAPGETPPRRADLDSLRDLVPDLWTVERWVRAQRWRA
jgi:uncharacterized protein YbjT (DUF2867 family)